MEFEARTVVGPPRLEFRVRVVPAPFVPNGPNTVRFQNGGVYSRPRRTSPKPPFRLTVERRLKVKPPPPVTPLAPWLLVLVVPPEPLSLFTPASSQNEADMPPPRSSTPRKPRRLLL